MTVSPTARSMTEFHRRKHGLCSDILKVMPLPPVIFR